MADIEGVKLNKIVKLAHSHQWVEWLKDVEGWIVSKDYDLPAPTPVAGPIGVQTQAMQVAHAALVTTYETANTSWKRSQFKAVVGIRSRCDTQATRLVKDNKYDYDRLGAITALEVKYKPNVQSAFSTANDSLNAMALDNYKSVSAYIDDFASNIATLELVGKPMDAPFSIPLFCRGMGPDYAGWHTSFNQLHSLFGPNPATLDDAFDSAETEAQRRGTLTRGHALLTARYALLAPTLNNKRKHQQSPSNTPSGKRGKCIFCAGQAGMDRFHTENTCWLKNPVLRTEWQAKYPEKARARKERYEAQGKPDPSARIAAIEEHLVPGARTARGGHEFRG